MRPIVVVHPRDRRFPAPDVAAAPSERGVAITIEAPTHECTPRADRIDESLEHVEPIALEPLDARRWRGDSANLDRLLVTLGFARRFRAIVTSEDVRLGKPDPEVYVHRVGRTARAEAVGDALTLVSPAEEGDLRDIERALGTRIPRRTLVGFDYASRPTQRLEIPLAERIAAIRARKAEERARSRANAARHGAVARATPRGWRPGPGR